MMLGAAGQCFCYFMLTILIRYTEKVGYPEASQAKVAEAAVAFFFLYYAFFGFSFQGIPWLYPTEINSTAMRTRGAAVGTATNWIVNFIVVCQNSPPPSPHPGQLVQMLHCYKSIIQLILTPLPPHRSK